MKPDFTVVLDDLVDDLVSCRSVEEIRESVERDLRAAYLRGVNDAMQAIRDMGRDL